MFLDQYPSFEWWRVHFMRLHRKWLSQKTSHASFLSNRNKFWWLIFGRGVLMICKLHEDISLLKYRHKNPSVLVEASQDYLLVIEGIQVRNNDAHTTPCVPVNLGQSTFLKQNPTILPMTVCCKQHYSCKNDEHFSTSYGITIVQDNKLLHALHTIYCSFINN